jgi:hypothetical protein
MIRGDMLQWDLQNYVKGTAPSRSRLIMARRLKSKMIEPRAQASGAFVLQVPLQLVQAKLEGLCR